MLLYFFVCHLSCSGRAIFLVLSGVKSVVYFTHAMDEEQDARVVFRCFLGRKKGLVITYRHFGVAHRSLAAAGGMLKGINATFRLQHPEEAYFLIERRPRTSVHSCVVYGVFILCVTALFPRSRSF